MPAHLLLVSVYCSGLFLPLTLFVWMFSFKQVLLLAVELDFKSGN